MRAALRVRSNRTRVLNVLLTVVSRTQRLFPPTTAAACRQWFLCQCLQNKTKRNESPACISVQAPLHRCTDALAGFHVESLPLIRVCVCVYMCVCVCVCVSVRLCVADELNINTSSLIPTGIRQSTTKQPFLLDSGVRAHLVEHQRVFPSPSFRLPVSVSTVAPLSADCTSFLLTRQC